MAKEKLDNLASARLGQEDAEWLAWWVGETAQDRSKPVRAAVKLLRIVTTGMTLEAAVRLIARLSSAESDDFPAAEAELWAAMAAKVVKQAESKKDRRRGP